eukprot:GEMP01073450.1.p1 GENE.GEMP01073450.1~~GEMP01073450.1.p1  ORF type:complete len:201 (+),score=37.22 GEMP01073450.1:63-665(+)
MSASGQDELADGEEPIEQKINGPDEFLFPSGARYVGTYIYDSDAPIYHGEGEYTHGFAVYSGTWNKGHLISGKYTAMGHEYEGEFNENFEYHGTGTYRWPDGRLYVGAMCCGKTHGRGYYEHFQRANNAIVENSMLRHRKLLSKQSDIAWSAIADSVGGGLEADIFHGVSNYDTFNSNAQVQASLIAPPPEEEEAPPAED